jgi:hypothetical protein
MSQFEGTIDYAVTGFGICKPTNSKMPSTVSFELTLEPLSLPPHVNKGQVKFILGLQDIKAIGVQPQTAKKIDQFLRMGETDQVWWKDMLLLNNEIQKRIYHHTLKMRID